MTATSAQRLISISAVPHTTANLSLATSVATTLVFVPGSQEDPDDATGSESHDGPALDRQTDAGVREVESEEIVSSDNEPVGEGAEDGDDESDADAELDDESEVLSVGAGAELPISHGAPAARAAGLGAACDSPIPQTTPATAKTAAAHA